MSNICRHYAPLNMSFLVNGKPVEIEDYEITMFDKLSELFETVDQLNPANNAGLDRIVIDASIAVGRFASEVYRDPEAPLEVRKKAYMDVNLVIGAAGRLLELK